MDIFRRECDAEAFFVHEVAEVHSDTFVGQKVNWYIDISCGRVNLVGCELAVPISLSAHAVLDCAKRDFINCQV